MTVMMPAVRSKNGMFREAKQAWFIQRPARNSMDSFRATVYLTIITMALTTAFTGVDGCPGRKKPSG